MITLSLSMIVRDEEKVLPRCLDTVRPYVDEIVIVDTGSTDRTKDVAKSFGARVHAFTDKTHPEHFAVDDGSLGGPPPFSGKPYLANFAAARNFSLEKTTGRFVLWLDADDVFLFKQNTASIGGGAGGGVAEMKLVIERMIAQNLDGAFLRYDCGPGSNGWRERIIRREASIKWHGMVHEVLFPHGKYERFEGICVRHAKDPSDISTEIAHRNLKILMRQLDAQQKDGGTAEPRTLFFLANEMRHVDVEAAKALYEQYFARAVWTEEILKARLNYAEIFENAKNYEAAFCQFAAATVDKPDFPEGWFGLARIAYWKGDWRRCVEWSEKGFSLGDPATMISFNALDRSYRPHVFMNVALSKLGRTEDALESCVNGLAICPSDPHLLANRKHYERTLGVEASSRLGVTSPSRQQEVRAVEQHRPDANHS